MRRSTLKECTVLIAQTGQSPLTLSLRVGPTIALISALIVTPLAILGFTIYSLHQKNSTLEQQNVELAESADEVMKEIDQLDSEIQDLQERAGVPDQAKATTEADRDRSRGGVAVQLEPEELLAIAKATLPSLTSQFHGEVKPALDETLEEEAARIAARPKGRPVKADLLISSRFGFRGNPFGRGYEVHNGIDFPGPQGTSIYATAPGKVEKAEYQRGYGYHVVIDHGYGYQTLYAHLSKMAVAKGDTIAVDQEIGSLGSTGRSTGPHLHYSVYWNGKAVDPMRYLNSPPSRDRASDAQ
ncbi:MAG: peptidoglycan DD-metalloendopeptidase family protein [Elainellaceae cyanobacterium]